MSELSKLLKSKYAAATPATPATERPKCSKSSNCSRGTHQNTHFLTDANRPQNSTDPIAERKRRRDEVLMLLSENPHVRYAYVVDEGTDPVIVAVGIRGVATFELNIPAERYDAEKFLAFVAESE